MSNYADSENANFWISSEPELDIVFQTFHVLMSHVLICDNYRVELYPPKNDVRLGGNRGEFLANSLKTLTSFWGVMRINGCPAFSPLFI